MQIIRAELDNLAIILGNGLNNFALKGTDWKKLLKDISGEKPDDEVDGLLESSELNYPEYFDALSYSNNQMKYYRTLKRMICSKILKWQNTETHEKFISFAISHQIPVLTTNFDLTLIDADLKAYMMSKKKSSQVLECLKPIHQQHYSPYLFKSYYSNQEIKDAKSQFGIWHMHGLACYSDSLRIGAMDYGYSISQYRDHIRDLTQKGYQNWGMRNSWLDIFLNCNLLIIGLGLSSQETSLRWLLVKREQLFKENSLKRRKTCYVVNKEFDCFSKPKEFYFDSLNISRLTINNSKDLYADWSVG